MKKYWALFRNCWLDALTYRAESFVWLLGDIMPSLVMVALWLTVYRQREAIAGYTLSMMVIYYLGMIVMETLFTPHCEQWLAWLIRQGELSSFLLRPISVIAYFMWTEVAWRILRFSLLLIPLGLVLPKLSVFISFPSSSFRQLAVLLLALPFSYLLHFAIKFFLGSTAFWLVEPRGLFNFFYIVNNVFSGAFLPLDLFPSGIVSLSNILPFKYIYYFPLNVGLGKFVGRELLLGLGIQTFWVIVFGLAMFFVWRRGLKRYAAVGG